MVNSHLSRGLIILEELDEARSVSDLRRRLGLPKSTISRILRELREQDWVQRRHDGTYVPGWRWQSLSGVLASSTQIARNLDELLTELRDATGWTVNYLTFTGHDAIRDQHFPGFGAEFAHRSIGEPVPLAFSATGSALLSALPESAAIKLLEAERSKRYNHAHSGILNLPSQMQVIRRVRSVGFSYSHRRCDPASGLDSFNCLATPVGETDETPALGAICVSRPAKMISRNELVNVSRAMLSFKECLSSLYLSRQ